MSIEIRYTLRVVGPDLKDIDPDTAAEIKAESEPTDDPADAVERWVGGYINDTEGQLSSWLPEGWYAKIDDAP